MDRAAAKWVIALAFVAVYLAARLPFFSHPIIGEEGLFANLFYVQPRVPNLYLLARVDSREWYEPVQHPSPPYVALRTLGAMASRLFPPATTPELLLVVVVRFCFSLLPLAAWLSLLALILRRTAWRDVWPMVLLVSAASLTPLAVGSSIMLYMDGSIGALLVALPALAALATHRRLIAPRWDAPLFGIAAALFGVAKPEWSVAFATATGVVLVWTLARRPLEKTAVAYWLAGLGGCIAGNALSYLFDPVNYLAHFGAVGSFRGDPRFAAMSFAEAGTWALVRQRLSLTAAPLLLLVLAGVAGWRQRSPLALWLFLFPAFLFGGYLSSLWIRLFDYRYFVPALMAGAIAVMALMPAPLGRRTKAAVLIIALLGAAQFVMFAHQAVAHRLSVTFGYGLPVRAYFADTERTIAEAKREQCVPVLPAWVKFKYPTTNTDFVIPSVKREDARRIVQKMGKPLCGDSPPAVPAGS